MGLSEYKKKREFTKTTEPEGKEKKSTSGSLVFVVQKHNASRLHYDFRLELDGVLKSWAIPKGPSLNPDDKRLAMMTEDHPMDYKSFEGVIPEGNYGAGEVIVWDEGTYHSYESDDPKEGLKKLRAGLEKGDFKFVLKGNKLNGAYALVKIKGKQDNAWLLIKKKDEFASTKDITKQNKSVISDVPLEKLTKENEKKTKELKKKPNKIFKEKKHSVRIPEGVPSKFPHKIKPMLATLVKEPFSSEEYLFEIKYDGYRTIAEVENGEVNLYSRNLNSFNEKFSSIGEELQSLDFNAVLDGEVVILDEDGRSNFQLLQNFQNTGEGNLTFFVFDILHFNGLDLTRIPLLRRKEILKEILPELSNIFYSDHIENDGVAFFELAKQKNLEGIIAKNKKSSYILNRRSKDWLKIKTSLRQEAVICGFTEPKGGRKHLGALVCGVYDSGKLKYIGHVGGGFDDKDLKEVKELLSKIVIKENPFGRKIPTASPITWVKPKYLCEVTFSEWTGDGVMRHPVYLGIREDKKPNEVIKEEPVEVETKKKSHKIDEEIIVDKHKLKITNLNKVFWPDEGYTKGDVIEYYRKVSKYILPYLKDRPESMLRHPNGITGKSFFHKNVGDLPPSWIKTKEIFSDSNEEPINYLICNNEATLVYMANLGCIEINPWFSRIQKPDKPDFLVIDLDPEDISFEKVIDTALAVKEILDKAGASSYIKTSGATGMHIYVPLGAKYDYDHAKDFAHLIGVMANQLVPDFTSLERSPSKRQKKVYLDYLQNRRGQTISSPYSIRPKPGATVSTPLDWKEVKSGLSPQMFNIKNIFARLDKKGDLFEGIFNEGIDMNKCIKNLGG